MTEVRALRLRLTVAEGRVARAQARTEEALRLAPEEHRLVVVRRLDVGRVPSGAPPALWQARVTDGMTAMTRAAVHATTPGAARAAAVWFTSAAEARALLLGELAAGRTPFGWFWALAVPEWRGAILSGWLSIELAAAARDPERLVQLAQGVMRIAAAGRLAALAAALPTGRMSAPADAAAAPTAPATPAGGVGRFTEAGPAPPLAGSAPSAEALVTPLLGRLDGTAVAAFHHELRRLPVDSIAASLLARLALAAAAPELASRPSVLLDLAQAIIAARLAPSAPQPSQHDPADRTEARSRQTDPPRPAAASPSPRAMAHAPSATEVTLSRQPIQPLEGLIDDDLPSLNYQLEQASAAAGVWLLVRPLVRLGFDEWLAARPDLAAAGCARGLLRRIIERQRIAADDPLFALLPAPAVPIDVAIFDLWRVALDRWLRRRIRRKLADVVARRGWLTPQETGVRVRFRLDQADIALRARGLDVDPGWTSWLGLTVTYDYRDEALR